MWLKKLGRFCANTASLIDLACKQIIVAAMLSAVTEIKWFFIVGCGITLVLALLSVAKLLTAKPTAADII